MGQRSICWDRSTCRDGAGLTDLEDGRFGRASEQVRLALASVCDHLGRVRVLVLRESVGKIESVSRERRHKSGLKADQDLLHLAGGHPKQLDSNLVEPRQPQLTGEVARSKSNDISVLVRRRRACQRVR